MDEDEDSQLVVFRRADIRRHLEWRDSSVSGWHGRREDLKKRGAIAVGQLTLGMIARSCLLLGQVSAVVDGDVAAARQHFSYPLDLKQPTFREIAGMLAQGVAGDRPWDGQLLNTGSELERMLCFLLVGRLDDLAHDYAASDDPALFSRLDHESKRSFLVRQIFHCATGQYDKVCFADFENKRMGFKKTEFGYGYEHLVDAIGRGDSEMFSRELQVREAAFSRRQRSRNSDRMWGYGASGRDSFDVFGTALCRLALARGLSFPTPSERFYPPAFWKAPAAQH